jgi:hypothetical protein
LNNSFLIQKKFKFLGKAPSWDRPSKIRGTRSLLGHAL